MTDQPTVHADDSVRAERGGSAIKITLVGMDKPFFTALAIVLALGAGIGAWIEHEADLAAINEESQWADLTYSREVQVQALLETHGISIKTLPPLTHPPRRYP